MLSKPGLRRINGILYSSRISLMNGTDELAEVLRPSTLNKAIFAIAGFG